MARKLLSPLLVLFMIFAIQANPVMAGKVLMKLQSQFPSKLPVGGTSILYFIDQVEKISNKEVRMKFFEPGKLVPPAGVLDAVSKGQVDAGVSSSAYWAGKLPAAPLFLSAPFDLDAPGRLAWLLHGNGLKLWQEMYDSAGYMALGEAKQAAVLKDNVENKGVIIKTWSPEMLDAFKKAWEAVAAEQSAKDPFFKKAWEDLSAFRAEYELWLDTGYLPRNCSYAK